MIATGDILNLPVPSSVPKPFSMSLMKRQDGRGQEPAGQHRIYRLPRNDSSHLAYTSDGYQILQQGTIGKIIDIYA
jgi:hypothetical protein